MNHKVQRIDNWIYGFEIVEIINKLCVIFLNFMVLYYLLSKTISRLTLSHDHYKKHSDFTCTACVCGE